MKVLHFLATIAVLFSLASGQCETPYHDCGSTDMKIVSLSIPGCCSPPCVLKRGTNATVTVVFTTDKSYKSMSQKLCGELNGLCIGINALPLDFCQFVAGNCPIEAGKQYSAKIELPIAENYPPLSVTGNWTFYEPNETTFIGCVEIPLKIQ